MTAQELFDKALAGLKAQDFKRSVDWEGSCLYNGPGGVRCAAGHCMTESQLSSVLEFEPLQTILDGAGFESLKPHLELMQALQNLHDEDMRGGDTEDFRHCLNRLANKFGLQSNTLQGPRSII